MGLQYFEQEIKEREEQIRGLEKEIEELFEQKANYIWEHCQYKNIKENKCDHFGDPLDIYGDCIDCSRHLDVPGRIKTEGDKPR